MSSALNLVKELLLIGNSHEFLKRVCALDPEKNIPVLIHNRILAKVTKLNNELCRECKHKRKTHRESGITLDTECRGADCSCKRFVPVDNLEFLEMKALDKSR